MIARHGVNPKKKNRKSRTLARKQGRVYTLAQTCIGLNWLYRLKLVHPDITGPSWPARHTSRRCSMAQPHVSNMRSTLRILHVCRNCNYTERKKYDAVTAGWRQLLYCALGRRDIVAHGICSDCKARQKNRGSTIIHEHHHYIHKDENNCSSLPSYCSELPGDNLLNTAHGEVQRPLPAVGDIKPGGH